MKKIYENIELEVIFFKEDIVTLSLNEKDDVGDDPFENDW